MLHNLAKCFQAGLVAKGSRPVSFFGPATVAIHYDSDMCRNIRWAGHVWEYPGTHAGSDFKELFLFFGHDFVNLADGNVCKALDFYFGLVFLIFGNLFFLE